MPSRFRDENSAQAFREKMAERARLRMVYAAECIEAVLPRPGQTEISKDAIFTKASEYAVSRNGLIDHEKKAVQAFWRGSVKRFQGYLERNWPEIRHILQEELGISVEFGWGLKGIRRAGKRGLLATLKWERGVHDGVKEGYNADVDAAEGFIEAPRISSKLIEPKAIGAR